MRPGVRRAAAVCVGLCLALLAAEVALRAIGRFAPPNSPPAPRYPGFYRPDLEIGYSLWPSRRTTYFYPVGSSNEVTLISNADGFRNAREFDSPDVRPRIWMLGDSMVLGDGVAAEHRLTEVIEQLEPGWRVDNLGMSGYGVDLRDIASRGSRCRTASWNEHGHRLAGEAIRAFLRQAVLKN